MGDFIRSGGDGLIRSKSRVLIMPPDGPPIEIGKGKQGVCITHATFESEFDIAQIQRDIVSKPSDWHLNVAVEVDDATAEKLWGAIVDDGERHNINRMSLRAVLDQGGTPDPFDRVVRITSWADWKALGQQMLDIIRYEWRKTTDPDFSPPWERSLVVYDMVLQEPMQVPMAYISPYEIQPRRTWPSEFHFTAAKMVMRIKRLAK